MNPVRQSAGAAVLCAGLAVGAATSPVRAQPTEIDIDAVEASIKAPDSAESSEAMQAQTAALRASSRGILSSKAALGTSNTIYVSHNRSLLEEAFYHLEQMVPYADYEERLYLQKLQSLKANKTRYDNREIDHRRFEVAAQRADRVYKEELEDARDYLAGKAARLMDICLNLDQNVDVLRENLDAAQSTSLPRALMQRITALRTHQTWLDFTTPTETGWHMRRALDLGAQELEEDIDPHAIVACVTNAFAAYEVAPGGPVIDTPLVKELVRQSKSE